MYDEKKWEDFKNELDGLIKVYAKYPDRIAYLEHLKEIMFGDPNSTDIPVGIIHFEDSINNKKPNNHYARMIQRRRDGKTFRSVKKRGQRNS